MGGGGGKRGKSSATAGKGSKGPKLAAVILAGGSGTRFWPRSRRAKPKQVLSLDGDRTMIQNTVERVMPVVSAGQVWIITNDLLAKTIAKQLPNVVKERILREPAARNTAPACGLAAFLLERESPDTVLGVFPSDHTIGDVERFRRVVCAGAELARRTAAIVVLGVSPSRPETGYGYIELGAAIDPIVEGGESIPVRRVRRFTEKPDKAKAKRFLRSGNYAWNSGMFLWRAKTLADAMREHQPTTAKLLASGSRWSTALQPS